MIPPFHERLEIAGFDEVHRLRWPWGSAFVALHAVLAGHTFGGIRLRAYAREEDALTDALALAQAMSRKVTLAGIVGGGAKAVLMEPPPGKRDAALEALGDLIESLDGRYHAGPDYGFTLADDAAVRRRTRFLAAGEGLAEATAEGVRRAMFAATTPAVVAVQGLGAVGLALARQLRERCVHVIAADTRAGATAGFEEVAPAAVFDVPCDVFAPCAVGGVLDAQTIARLRCRVVCGAANNPLASADGDTTLKARGIVLVPDFLANAGAVVVGASRELGETHLIAARMDALGERVSAVLERAAREDRTPQEVAVELADAQIARLRRDRQVG